MTRKSKRELERALEKVDVDEPPHAWQKAIPREYRESSVRAYQYALENGLESLIFAPAREDGPSLEAVLERLSRTHDDEEIRRRLTRTLEELRDGDPA